MNDDVDKLTAENLEATLVGNREMIHKKLIEMTHTQFDVVRSFVAYAYRLAEIGFIKRDTLEQVKTLVAENSKIYDSLVNSWLNMVGVVEGREAQ